MTDENDKEKCLALYKYSLTKDGMVSSLDIMVEICKLNNTHLNTWDVYSESPEITKYSSSYRRGDLRKAT